MKENCTQRFKTRERSITLAHATTPKQMPTALKALENKFLSIFERHLVSVNISLLENPRQLTPTISEWEGSYPYLPDCIANALQ